jgi:hypothetical protein
MERTMLRIATFVIAALLLSVPAGAQGKGKSGSAPGRNDATPGQMPGAAKDNAPGRLQGDVPGSAKNLAPGADVRTVPSPPPKK